MKRLTALFFSLTLVFSLTACGSNNAEPDSSETPGAASAEPDNTETASADISEAEKMESTGGKTLVVYYSATGNTEKVANAIADTLGADVFELEPVEPYSNDDLNWTNDDSRVSREHENEDERDVELVSETVDNWSDYDTVFIGRSGGASLHGQSMNLSKPMILLARPSFRLPPLQAPAWDKVANCWRKWPEQATGRRVSVSAKAHLRKMSAPGQKDWDCKGVLAYEKNTAAKNTQTGANTVDDA